jgi:hypothetical protein
MPDGYVRNIYHAVEPVKMAGGRWFPADKVYL